jgi:thymidylate kinase
MPAGTRAGGSRLLATRAASGTRFTVLEGLSAVGKSTIAPMLADALGAEFIPSVLPEFEHIRRRIDRGPLVMARLHFWLMSNYALSERVSAVLAAGRDVVVESYFYRTLATHTAMGAVSVPEIDWSRAAVPDLAVLLTVDETVRKARLDSRGQGRTFWHQLEQPNVAVTRAVYSTFGLVPVDTTGLSPAEVTSQLVRLADSVRARHA